MYILKDTFETELKEFREIGRKFLNKELSVAKFKSKSGGMGIYAQRGGEKFMIRLRISAGVFDLDKMKLVKKYCEQYNVDKIHLSTRSAVQIHNISIDDACDIIQNCFYNGIQIRGGGGNYPRNVALSPLSGVEIGEAFDVTPYALLTSEYFKSQMHKYKLPRKLKVAFSNSSKDMANATLTDLGFLAVNSNNKNMFKLYLAGGLGRNPLVGLSYDELVNPNDTLYYVEAMTRLFTSEGNYENKNKARVRYILEKMGNENFLKCYKKHLNNAKKEMKLNSVTENKHEINFSANESIHLQESNCLIKQKQKGLWTVIIKPIGGQLNIEDFNKIIDFIENKEHVQVRLSMEESLYIRNLTDMQAKKLLEITNNITMKTKLEQSVSCIGTPICQMGIEQSQKMLKEILQYFKDKNMSKDILPSIYISGCGNSCSRHQVAEIGLAGKKVKVNNETKDAFEIHINGMHSEDKTRLGKIYGDIVTDKIPDFLYELACVLEKNNCNFTTYYENNVNGFDELISKYLV